MPTPEPPSPRQPPRFVPTLTEVVSPSAAVAALHSAPLAAGALPPVPQMPQMPDAPPLPTRAAAPSDALNPANISLNPLAPALQAQINAAISRVMDEQWRDFNSRVQLAIHDAVETAIQDALTQHGLNPLRTNP